PGVQGPVPDNPSLRYAANEFAVICRALDLPGIISCNPSISGGLHFTRGQVNRRLSVVIVPLISRVVGRVHQRRVIQDLSGVRSEGATGMAHGAAAARKVTDPVMGISGVNQELGRATKVRPFATRRSEAVSETL